jgi:hypothetical protein
MIAPNHLLLAAGLSLATGLPPPEPGADAWLVVRGRDELTAPMSYGRLIEVYLPGAAARVVPAAGADGVTERNRMVVGTPGDNALLAELLPELGVAHEGDALAFRGRSIGAGQGLVLVADDVDGDGLLVVFTGASAEGLFTCFTTSIDVKRHGFTITERNRKVATGDLAAELDTSRPVVVRLDLALEHLLADAVSWSPAEAELHAARGLAGWGFVLQGVAGPQRDAATHVRAVRADASGLAARARQAFAGRDVAAEVLAAYERVRSAVLADEERSAASLGPAPAFYVLNDPALGTNGRTFDPDPVTGRPSVALNLAPLARDGNLGTVALHESLHTFQAPDTGATRVMDRGRREGVATAATQVVDPDVGDAAALLWSEAALAAAVARRAELVRAFRRDAASTDQGLLRAWFTLGVEPPVAGAPSRSGYYIMWLAARAWLAAHPGAALRELLDAPAEDLLAALG